MLDVSPFLARVVIVWQFRIYRYKPINELDTSGLDVPLFHVQGEFLDCWLENVYVEDLPILHVDDVDDPHQCQRVSATVRSHM